MDLKKYLPGQSKEEPAEYFWSIIIEPGWVTAGIWRIQGETAQVIHGSTPYPWELDDELINSADTALAGAIQGFPQELDEPSKTVFGVVSTWVSEGQIKEEYLERIKRICSDLSLTPIGFVVIPEAISHLLKSEEEAPVNAILVGMYKDVLEVSVFKLGNLLGTTQVTRSLSIIDDVAEGISRFAKSDSVPSRLVLYDGRDGELEETRESLLSVNWEEVKSIQFLHTPKIEVFSPSRKVDAVSLAGASEVSGVTTLIGQGKEMPQEDVQEELPPAGEVENVSEVAPEDLGFVVDQGMEESAFDEKPVGFNPFSRPVQEEGPMQEQNFSPEQSFEEPKRRKIKFDPHQFTSVFSRIKMPFGSAGSEAKKPIFIGLAVFLILIIGSFAAWWYFPKATVTLYISPRQLDERVEISVDPTTSSSNTESKVLAGETVKTQVKGEKTKQTSGTKTVGDKATGEVTLYRVGSALTLRSGTVITGPDRLKFVLDENVEVASGSASSPGTATGKVVAEAIGAQYNLAEDTSFTVGSYTNADIEAKNESSFSGGSSREISAVSTDDQKTLEAELTEELIERATKDLSEALSEDVIFVDDSLVTNASTKDFTNKVGDEAKSLGLKLTLDAEAVTVKKSELLSLAEDSVKQKVPEGFVLREDQIETSFEFLEKEGNKYKFSVLVSANLLPEIKTDEIAEKISGKYPGIAQEYLVKEVPGFSRAEIILKPKLPGKLGTLPQMVRNIEVEVAAER